MLFQFMILFMYKTEMTLPILDRSVPKGSDTVPTRPDQLTAQMREIPKPNQGQIAAKVD